MNRPVGSDGSVRFEISGSLRRNLSNAVAVAVAVAVDVGGCAATVEVLAEIVAHVCHLKT